MFFSAPVASVVAKNVVPASANVACPVLPATCGGTAADS